MRDAGRRCHSRILAADAALDRLWVDLMAIDLAIDVVDDLGLGNVSLRLSPHGVALDLHCRLGADVGL